MSRIVAVANQKGGVGKTTTTVNVAAAIGLLDMRVLVIDLDPQGNASTGLGILRDTPGSTVYEVLFGEVSLVRAARPTSAQGVDCVPASPDLAGAEVELVGVEAREQRLATALRSPDTDVYDLILIDCPPSLGLLTVNALVCATDLFVPIQAEFYALDGVGQLVHTVELVRSALNPQLEIALVAMTMVAADDASQSYVIDEVGAYFGDRLAPTSIPRDPALSAAPSIGQSVLSYAPLSAGALAYTSLAQELLNSEKTVKI